MCKEKCKAQRKKFPVAVQITWVTHFAGVLQYWWCPSGQLDMAGPKWRRQVGLAQLNESAVLNHAQLEFPEKFACILHSETPITLSLLFVFQQECSFTWSHTALTVLAQHGHCLRNGFLCWTDLGYKQRLGEATLQGGCAQASPDKTFLPWFDVVYFIL